MCPNNRELGARSERNCNPAVRLAIAVLAISGLGCRRVGEAGSVSTGFAIDDGGRSVGGAEVWVTVGRIGVDVSAAHRRYGELVRAEFFDEHRRFWGVEAGRRGRGAAPVPPGFYIEELD